MEVTIIRRTKRSLLPVFIVALLINFVVVVEWMKKPALSSLPPWEVLPGLFCFCLLVYSVIRFFTNRKGKIIISREGVLVNGYGRVNWDSMDSYGIFDIPDAEGDKEPYLIIRLKNSREVKCLVHSLDQSGPQIVTIMKKYQEAFDGSIQQHNQAASS